MLTKALRILALLLAIAVLGLWFLSGAHGGWTKTSVPIKKTDPVTEIEYVEYEKRFVPGVDFVGAGLAVSGVIFAFAVALSGLHAKTQTKP